MLLVRKEEWFSHLNGKFCSFPCADRLQLDILKLSLSYESITIQPTPYYCDLSRFSVNLLVYFTSNASEIVQYRSIFVILPIRSRLAQVKWKKLRFKCENHVSVA